MTTLINKGHGHAKTNAVLKPQNTVENYLVKFVPCGIIVRAAHDDSFFNAPCFTEMSMPDNLIFHAVILCIDACG